MAMDLILLRHGETDWTISGRHTGRTDIPLTTAGEREARDAGVLLEQVLDGRSADAVFVSPLRRARQTAAIALPTTTPIEEPLIAEFDYGDYEGLTSAEIHARHPGWSIFTDGCPGGEHPEDVAGRAHRFLTERLAGSGLAVAVTHGHMSRFLALVALGLPLRDGRHLGSSTASISLITRSGAEPTLDLWNAAPRAGRP